MEKQPAEWNSLKIDGKQLPGQKGKRFSWQDMRLQNRLVLLMLVISIPVIVLAVLLLYFQAAASLRQKTDQQLGQENNAIFLKAQTWIEMNASLLKQMAALDDIVSMDPARQKQVLVKTAQAFPYIYLAHTINPAGLNVARNDDQANKDYSYRDYFKSAMNGEPVAYQVVIGASNNLPALIMAAPIKDSGKVIGVISIACELDTITQEVLKNRTAQGQEGFTTFIIDQNDYVVAHPDEKIAHPDSNVVQGGLTNYKNYPPVAALRQGKQGIFEFTDENGRRWLAYLTQMENGWGVITQQAYDVAFASVSQVRLITFLLIAGGIVLLAALSFVFIRRSLQPMSDLYATVKQVTAGDLNKVASVTRDDEVGQLARAFNLLTAQLRENIANLEQRVQERTKAMSLSADVSRRVSTILTMEQLTREVVNEVQHAFNYYHVHIYLFDEARRNLVMVGGTGEAGQVMLARKHHIPAGRGLVGRAAETNASVLVSDTSQDPGWLPNPLLPETKSELAVPIATNDRVLGVLDVQQNIVDGLTKTDVDLIQLTANQVAIALQNAMAYAQAQQKAEREARVAALGQKIQQATTIDEVLQVSLRELGQVLGAQHSNVELHSGAAAPGDKKFSSRSG